MALQGTLDTFALPDVLRLLGTTHKTGRLDLEGDRGCGAAWVNGGLVVAAEAGRTTEDLAEALFELLRFTDGTFNFDAASIADDAPEGVEVEELLARAEEMLAEWRAIEQVVPSLDLQVVLRRDLPSSHVKIDRNSWATIATIGAGTTVRRLGEELGVGEIGVCRSVKTLVETGVVELHEVPATIAEPEGVEAIDEIEEIEAIEACEPEAMEEPEAFEPEAVEEPEPQVAVEPEPVVDAEPVALNGHVQEVEADHTWPADEPGTGAPVEWFERWRDGAAGADAGENETTDEDVASDEPETFIASDEPAEPSVWFDREPDTSFATPEPVETNDSLWDRLDALREAFDESDRLEAALAASDAPKAEAEADAEVPAAEVPSLPGDPTADLFSTPAPPESGETTQTEPDTQVDRASLLKFLSSVKR